MVNKTWIIWIYLNKFANWEHDTQDSDAEIWLPVQIELAALQFTSQLLMC